MVHQPWMPFPALQAVQKQCVFESKKLEKYHKLAVIAYLDHRAKGFRDRVRHKKMMGKMEQLLDEASKVKATALEKKKVSRYGLLQSWRYQLETYLLIVCVLFATRFAASWIEVFPGGVQKPKESRAYDLGFDIFEFLVAIAHWRWGCITWAAALTGVTGLVFKFLKAWSITRLVPRSQVENLAYRFNFAVPGVIAALSSILVLLAGRDKQLAVPTLLRDDGIFQGLNGYGKGLVHEEKELIAFSVVLNPLVHRSGSR